MTWHGSNVNEARALLQQQEGHGPAVSSRLGVIVYMPTSLCPHFLSISMFVCFLTLFSLRPSHSSSSIFICQLQSAFLLFLCQVNCHVHLYALQGGFCP